MSDHHVIAEALYVHTSQPVPEAECRACWQREDIRVRARYLRMADAALAALRESRTVRTVEELDALPEGAVVRASDGAVWDKYQNSITRKMEWQYIGESVVYDRPDCGPWLILFRPDEDGDL